MSKELMKKTILPMLLLAVWAWIAYHFCVSLEQTELWKIWMVVGMPFGIHRMCIWLLPKNFDIGGTVGVWAMNIIVGCLIGEVPELHDIVPSAFRKHKGIRIKFKELGYESILIGGMAARITR